MASPQLENGYTPIANEILEALGRTKLNGTQYRILMILFRYTFGFQRKESAFSEKFISKATGINKVNISREIKELISRKIIKVISESTYTVPRSLEFNKNYEEWEHCDQQLANHTTVSELTNTTVSELTNQEIKHINKTINKNNAQKICACDFFESIWSLYPRKIGKARVTKKALKEINAIGLEKMIECIKRYKKEISDNNVDEKFIMHGSTFFNGRYKDYLETAEPEEKGKDNSTQYYEELARKYNMTVEEVKKQIEKQRNY